MEGEKDIAKEAVLVRSQEMPQGTPIVKGYDFNNGLDYHGLLQSFRYSGFQATSFGCAVEEINKMLAKREEPLPSNFSDDLEEDEFIKIVNNCTVFLGYTSNMSSCGVRETIRYLVEHRLVDALVTTAGGVEEDLIKCLAPTYLGDWHLPGKELRSKGLNRIGNLIVPNDNYCLFEDWVMPRLDKMLEEQRTQGVVWSPSTMIARLGSEVNDPSSIAYWAAKNKIPMFSPALTDGSLGDMMYFHGIKSPGLVLDINSDLRRLNQFAKKSVNTGMVIVGGGVVKHHICNANLMQVWCDYGLYARISVVLTMGVVPVRWLCNMSMKSWYRYHTIVNTTDSLAYNPVLIRNGANYSVFLNSASEWDGSDSGARPDEAVSWGKIKLDANPVKIYGEASFVFPLLAAETFVRHHNNKTQDKGQDNGQNK